VPVFRCWTGWPLWGRGSVVEVRVGHVGKPVVTDGGYVAVECDSVDGAGNRVIRDRNRGRHRNREQHDRSGRCYAGINVTGKDVASNLVSGEDYAGCGLHGRVDVQGEAGVPVATRDVIGK